jgi:hypothetical protein
MSSSPHAKAEYVPAVPPPAQGHKHVPLVLCRCGATADYPHQKHDAKLDTTIPVLDLTQGSPDDSLKHVAPDQESTELKKSPNNIKPSEQPDVDMPERTEVPNTPTQRSSQFNIPSPVLKIHYGGASEKVPGSGSGSDDESILIEPNPPPRSVPATKSTLCSICKSMHVLAKSENGNAIW